MARQRLGEQWAGLSVSRGITLQEHLIMTFERVLEHAGVTCERPDAVNRLLKRKKLTTADQFTAAQYLQNLSKSLNEVAPEGCCFGVRQGSSSNYGFWAE